MRKSGIVGAWPIHAKPPAICQAYESHGEIIRGISTAQLGQETNARGACHG
jgi:hypothetical protein